MKIALAILLEIFDFLCAGLVAILVVVIGGLFLQKAWMNGELVNLFVLVAVVVGIARGVKVWYEIYRDNKNTDY